MGRGELLKAEPDAGQKCASPLPTWAPVWAQPKWSVDTASTVLETPSQEPQKPATFGGARTYFPAKGKFLHTKSSREGFAQSPLQHLQSPQATWILGAQQQARF